VITGLLLEIATLTSSRVEAAEPSSAQHRAAEELKRTGEWVVRWDEETGSPATIEEQELSVGAAYRRPRSFAPDSCAESFIREHSGLFPLRPGIDGLVVKQIESTPRRAPGRGPLHVVRVEQTYMGLPVEFGGYTISMSPDGKVLFMNGRFFGGIDLDPRPSMDADECARIAIQEVGAGADSITKPIRLVVKRHASLDRLVWAVTVPEHMAHVWVVHVDAHDGRVIDRANLVIIDPR
jgi:hypothetical protein